MLGPYLELFAVLYVLSSFVIIPLGKRELVALLLCVLNVMSLLSFLTLPRGTIGWSVVCDCGSWLYSLIYFFNRFNRVRNSLENQRNLGILHLTCPLG